MVESACVYNRLSRFVGTQYDKQIAYHCCTFFIVELNVFFAKTIKGKGVSFMENQAGWHGKAPNDEEYEQAIKELDEQIAKIGEA